MPRPGLLIGVGTASSFVVKGGDYLVRPPHLAWVSCSFKRQIHSHLPADFIATDLLLITTALLDLLLRWVIIREH